MEESLICLDTSVLIDYFRKVKKENSYLYQISEQYDRFAVSAITKFEIYAGSTENQLEFWNQFFSRITILPFTTGTSQIAAHIFQQLKSKNKLIGIPDIFIGATAIENDLKLATLNVKDFVRIDQLILLQ